MEKAILKTLIYADIFDYPLNTYEIHRWLIGPPSLKLRRVNKQITLRQVEKTLRKLNQESRRRRGSPKAARIKNQGKYYFLRKRDGVVAQRIRREKQSRIFFRKVKILSQILKIIPWIKLVGISGGLAVNNAGKGDDIDLFIITRKNRLWVSRLLALGLLSLTGQRRKKGDSGRKIAGKLCLNILLEEDKLEQKNKDIYVAHEVLQMKILWQRDGVYSKYLEDNAWVFQFLPNWIGNSQGFSVSSLRGGRLGDRRSNLPHQIGRLPRPAKAGLAMTGIENLAKKFQLKIMQPPKGMERIEDGALYFHPEDCRLAVLAKYQQKLKKIISP